jgi:hypothetical protein
VVVVIESLGLLIFVAGPSILGLLFLVCLCLCIAGSDPKVDRL